MKRIAVFTFYDKENIVDEYVYFLLKEIKKVVSYLVVVCNCKISVCDNRRMSDFADEVYERENRGFDAGAVKDAILHYIGIEKLKEYEELLIVNDTVYGPLYPLQEVFERMEKEDTDFWGLTQVEATDYHPSYLQSYFLAVREKMLHSIDFMNYWKEMQYYEGFREVLHFYEQCFTTFFEGKGYRRISYVDTSAYRTAGEKVVPNPYYHLFEEIRQGRHAMPFVKKKPLADKQESMGSRPGILFESFIRALRRIESQEYFDFNMAWDNLLRIYPLDEIQKGCHLSYVLPFGERNAPHIDGTSLLILRIESDEFLPEIIRKCNLLPQETELRIFASDNLATKLKEGLNRKFTVNSIDLSADIFREEKKGDYRCIGMIDTRDFADPSFTYMERKSRFLCCFENMMMGNAYISRIYSLFERTPRLGMLFPPHPFNAHNSGNKQPFFSGLYSFWVRGSIWTEFIKSISDISDINFDGKLLGERVALYAQSKKYCAGIVKNSEYAAIDAEMKEEYLFELIDLMGKTYGTTDYFEQKGFLFDQIRIKNELMPFIRKHKRIFVYGAGEIARKLAPMIPHIDAFLVSDGRADGDLLYEIPVINFSDYVSMPEDGIILALNEKNSWQVRGMFEEKQIKADCWAYSV